MPENPTAAMLARNPSSSTLETSPSLPTCTVPLRGASGPSIRCSDTQVLHSRLSSWRQFPNSGLIAGGLRTAPTTRSTPLAVVSHPSAKRGATQRAKVSPSLFMLGWRVPWDRFWDLTSTRVWWRSKSPHGSLRHFAIASTAFFTRSRSAVANPVTVAGSQPVTPRNATTIRTRFVVDIAGNFQSEKR
jgi:hypothetical protein